MSQITPIRYSRVNDRITVKPPDDLYPTEQIT